MVGVSLSKGPENARDFIMKRKHFPENRGKAVKSRESDVDQSDDEADDEEIGEREYERSGTRLFGGILDAKESVKGFVEEGEQESDENTDQKFLDNGRQLKRRRKGDVPEQGIKTHAELLKKVEAAKIRIAAIATKITANPEGNVGSFHELRKIAAESDGQTAALTILTEMQLYKDVAPAYRIKSISEAEASVKVSKQTARIRNFEQTFLLCYQKFLASIKAQAKGNGWRSDGARASKKTEMVRHASCTALCEAAKFLIHFNEAEQLVSAVTELCTSRDGTIRKQASSALKDVLRQAHKSSGTTLKSCIMIAQSLSRAAIARKGSVPSEAIDPLLEIKLTQFRSNAHQIVEKPKKQLLDRKALYAARKAAKRRKGKRPRPDAGNSQLERDLLRDMREREAEASPAELANARKDILHWTCKAYFTILKSVSESTLVSTSTFDRKNETKKGKDKVFSSNRMQRPPPVLAAILDGLCHVAPLISSALVESLLAALMPLLESSRLPLSAHFRCIAAAYSVLSSHATSREISPSTFVSDTHKLDAALYVALGCLFDPLTPSLAEDIATDAVKAVTVATRSRRLPIGRASALSRRLINCALFAPTHACSVGLLTAALPILPPRIVSRIYPQTVSQDELLGISGVLLLEMAKDLEDPDTTNAEHSAPWDLSLLTRHWHPEVQRLAIECSRSRCGENISDLSRDAVKAIASFDGSRGGFNPVPHEQCGMKKGNKRLPGNNDFDWPQERKHEVLNDLYWNAQWHNHRLRICRKQYEKHKLRLCT